VVKLTAEIVHKMEHIISLIGMAEFLHVTATIADEISVDVLKRGNKTGSEIWHIGAAAIQKNSKYFDEYSL
jgi:hypothetical protein